MNDKRDRIRMRMRIEIIFCKIGFLKIDGVIVYFTFVVESL
jgi:hypothetical protein